MTDKEDSYTTLGGVVAYEPTMVKRLKPFERGFNSGDGTDEDENIRATADWVTNALRMRVPADDPERMTVAAAFISREEFLHGKWIVAIIHSLAHLSLAADDALAELVTAEQAPDSGEVAFFEVIDTCNQAQNELLAPMKPFIEAVDKFQLLSVIDEEFVNAVRETYEAAEGEKATDEFDDKFYKMHEEEIEIATGQRLPDGEDIYVNPLYFHALSDIVVTDWTGETDGPGDNTGGNTAQGRAIAEAVARATLDVPHPIAPLGTPQFEWFDSLRAPAVELDPVTPDELVSDDRYPMSRSEFERYLGDYPKTDGADADDDGEFDGTLVDDIDFDYSYDDARNDWVARAFVNARKALADLRDEDEVDLGEIDPEDLRQLLVERVHGVDIDSTSTMLDQPTALLDIPRQIETNTPDEDVMSAEGKPLPKVLMEAFEHHGSFGTVVYNLTEDDIKYQLNWHARDRTVDAQHYQHVPDGIENYAQLWHHYYFWKALTQHLWDASDTYRRQLLMALVDEFETKQEADRLLSRVAGRPDESARSADRPSSTISVAADSQHVTEGSANAGGFDEGTDEHFEKTTLLERHSTRVLRELANERELQTELDPTTLDEIECPLCNIRSTPCGGDDGCANEDTLSTFEDRLPTLVAQLATL